MAWSKASIKKMLETRAKTMAARKAIVPSRVGRPRKSIEPLGEIAVLDRSHDELDTADPKTRKALQQQAQLMIRGDYVSDQLEIGYQISLSSQESAGF